MMSAELFHTLAASPRSRTEARRWRADPAGVVGPLDALTALLLRAMIEL
jgi:hypothetical protein